MIGIWLQVYLTLCFEIISAGWRVVVSGAVSCVFYTASYTTQMILWSIQINRRSAKSRFEPYLKDFSEQIVGLIWWFKFGGKKLKLEYTCVWKRQDTISRVTGSWKRLKTHPLFKPTAVSSLLTPSYISEWLWRKRVNSNWSILTNEHSPCMPCFIYVYWAH